MLIGKSPAGSSTRFSVGERGAGHSPLGTEPRHSGGGWGEGDPVTESCVELAERSRVLPSLLMRWS